MKCVIMFYKGKKKQRWASAKGRLSSERKQSLELKIIHYFFFNRHLLQTCYVTYSCARNLNEILLFKAMSVVIVPVLFNNGTLCL